MKTHDDYVRRFRELARELQDLRLSKQHDLTKPSAVDAAEETISHPEANTAWLDVEGNKLLHEVELLRQMPDATGYGSFVAPELDDDPFDF